MFCWHLLYDYPDNRSTLCSGVPMIARRKFIALGAGLTASLFAAGHSRMRQIPTVESKVLVKPGVPSPQSVPMWAPTTPQAPGERYAPPITDYHPDNLILDQIAADPVELLPPPDVVLSAAQRIAFNNSLARLRRLQRYVGHGNFNIIGWDQSLKTARRHDAIGAFDHSELELIENCFSPMLKPLVFTATRW